MFEGRVDRCKRGFWGPKFKTVYSAVGVYPEPILAEMSKYNDEDHRKTFIDHTGSHGDFRDPSDGVKEYDLDNLPDDVELDDLDHIDMRAGRAYKVEDVDNDIPF